MTAGLPAGGAAARAGVISAAAAAAVAVAVAVPVLVLVLVLVCVCVFGAWSLSRARKACRATRKPCRMRNYACLRDRGGPRPRREISAASSRPRFDWLF